MSVRPSAPELLADWRAALAFALREFGLEHRAVDAIVRVARRWPSRCTCSDGDVERPTVHFCGVAHTLAHESRKPCKSANSWES